MLDIESGSDISDLEVVFGIGTTDKLGVSDSEDTLSLVGYRGMNRNEFLRNFILESEIYDSEVLLNETIPNFLKQTDYVPFYKFLADAGYLDRKGNVTNGELDDRILKEAGRGLEKFRPTNFADNTLERIQNSYSGVAQLAKKEAASRVLHLAPCLEEFQLSSKEVRTFLLENLDLLDSPKTHYRTNFGKLVCLYDYLKFKRKR